jgi:hypothetical protein
LSANAKTTGITIAARAALFSAAMSTVRDSTSTPPAGVRAAPPHHRGY